MRKPSRLRAGLAAAALALGTGGVIAAAAPASASTVRGIDVYKACHQQYPNAFLEWEIYATAKPSNPWSWQCWDGSAILLGGVSMLSACKEQYNSNSVAYLAYPFNAYSWRCT